MNFKDNFDEISLQDALEFVVDNRGKTAPVDDSGIPLIATNCVSNDELYPKFENLRYVSQNTYDTWFRSHPEPGDILLTNKGSQNGAVCLVPDPVNFCIAQDMVAIRANSNKIDPLFLFAALRSVIIQSRIKQLNVDAVIPHFKKTDFDKLFIPLPTPKAQYFIGQLYFNFSKKIHLNNQINQTLEEIAQAIFKSWFVDFDPVKAKIAAKANGQDPERAAMLAISGKSEETFEQLSTEQKQNLAETAALFPDAMQDSELGEIPKGWEVSTLSAEFKITMGQSPPGHTYNEDQKGIPFFQGRRDFGWRYPENRVYCTEPKRFAQKGDTLLSVRAPVGDINKAMSNCCIGRGLSALRHLSNSESYTYYTLEYLKNKFNDFDSEGTVFGSINKKDLGNIKIVKPYKELVTRFIEITKPIDENIFIKENENRILKNIRDTLLPKLLSGELSVANAERMAGGAGV